MKIGENKDDKLQEKYKLIQLVVLHLPLLIYIPHIHRDSNDMMIANIGG